jgi:hypothetical protein
MTDDTKNIFKRSLSLSRKTNDDLLALCASLGVNPHSYMVNELAKSIQRDSMTYQMKENTADQLTSLFATLTQDQEKEV